MTTRSSVRAPFLVLAAAAVASLAACAGDAPEEAGGEPAAAQDTTSAPTPTRLDTQAVTVTDVGLRTPESVIHDPNRDVYLVSNINGGAVEKDDDGFIARVRPDGTVETLHWIDGASAEVTLHAPKGLALKGDTLFVADIDSVRAFHRETGEPFGARGVPGATFLNDLAVGPDGTLYVTDSGLTADFSPSGSEAVYRFEGKRPVPVAEGPGLGGPNGIVVDRDGLVVVTFGAAEVRRIPLDGGPGTTLATLPGGQLDGVVRPGDGSLLVTSWETETVYRVGADGGSIEAVVEGVPSPADMGWDAGRRRLLIPLFTRDRLVLRPIR